MRAGYAEHELSGVSLLLNTYYDSATIRFVIGRARTKELPGDEEMRNKEGTASTGIESNLLSIKKNSGEKQRICEKDLSD